MSADEELLGRLRAGDEEAFVALVSRHHDSMLRLARTFVSSNAVAEEVVQDTWLGVVRGIDRFGGRSTLRTWLFTILVNRARSAGDTRAPQRRGRATSSPASTPLARGSRRPRTGPRTSRSASAPRPSASSCGRRSRELPARQLAVVTLRDIEGLRSDEVCEVLAISEGNQRVLLHRGRNHLRECLEAGLAP